MKKRLNLNTIGVKSMAKFHLLFIAFMSIGTLPALAQDSFRDYQRGWYVGLGGGTSFGQATFRNREADACWFSSRCLWRLSVQPLVLLRSSRHDGPSETDLARLRSVLAVY